MKIIALFFIPGLVLLPFKSDSQDVDSLWRKVSVNEFYLRYTPIDYLNVLVVDFKNRNGINVFTLTPAPNDWIKEEHIESLMKCIFRTDSTKSIMSVYSSYLPGDKYSSVGREAQNLIRCYRQKTNYPDFLNSFGPPDRLRAKELVAWWNEYKLSKK